jgi:sugar lactone lactonase YvrE
LAFLGPVFFPAHAAAQSNTVAAYTWTTLAGFPGLGSVDGVGGAAQFNQPGAVATDVNGNVYVADTYNHTIRKLTPPGIITTIAGLASFPGHTDGMNSAARFNYPAAIAVDTNGNLFVGDLGNALIRKLTPSGTNWIVSTIAGSVTNFGTADGIGTNATFGGIQGIAVDNSGKTVYVADTDNNRIRRVLLTGSNWVVTTLVGGSQGGLDGTNAAAQFDGLTSIVVDTASNIFVADTFNSTVRKVSPVGTNWVVTTIAGSFYVTGTADGTNGAARFNSPAGIALDSANNLIVSDSGNNNLRKMSKVGTNWVVTFLAGSPTGTSYGSTDGTGANALFSGPVSVAVDGTGTIYVAEVINNEIRVVTSAGIVSTAAGLAGSSGGANGTGSDARFNNPFGLTASKSGNLFVADNRNHTIRKITAAGVVSTLAGVTTNAGSVDGVGGNARFAFPAGVVLDNAGNFYVTDSGSNIIRKITAAGVVSTIAGLAGNAGSANGTNNVARFNLPLGLAIDAATNLYVVDAGNHTIRRISPVGTNWVVTTIAGLAGVNGSANGTNSAARFYSPVGITVDSATNLYVADQNNNTIRKLTPAGTNWVVSTIAGLAGSGGGADGIGSAARFFVPDAIAADAGGNLYVADFLGQSIRKLTLSDTNWVVSTIGGTYTKVGSADGAGSAAQFHAPGGIAVDSAGTLYVSDSANNTIRKGVFSAFVGLNQAAFNAPPLTGQLKVVLLPPEANGQWRFAWELGWHNSGEVISNLAQANYPVQFRSVPGYVTIQTNFNVSTLTNTLVVVTNLYYPTVNDGGTGGPGSLTVNITPNSPPGSGWRFLGEPGWRAPGSTATNLLPDVYLIEFEPVSGRTKPANQAVQVYAGLPTIISANYLLAGSPPPQALLPFPVPAGNISNLNSYPFGFNGQLQSDLGFGSGAVVGANVVLTAAHLVFNDQTLSYVSRVYWYFRQETGVYAPQPQLAHGWYVLSGYASARTNDLQSGLVAPDQSTPQSRNFDVAAIYFDSAVANGGYGGYLPSDASPNPWLTGNSLKMLVGYPVDGSLFGNASIIPGVMYQTDPQPYPLSLAPDSVTNQQVYIAPWFLSYPGNSGGPVYVQFNGYFYPAGVYLGTLFNGSQPYASAVRAIDSAVVNLITNAANLGDNGTNYTGGGVLTIIPNQAINAANPGYLQFQLKPASAVAAGAGWRLTTDVAYSSATNYTRAVLTTNAFAVEFKPVPGWITPTSQAVSVLPNQITTYSASYTVTNPVLVANGSTLGLTGTTGTVYRIEQRTSLTTGSWLPFSTNTISTSGFNVFLANPATNGSVNFYRAVWLGQ